MSEHRFFLPEDCWEGEVFLPEAEARHCVEVLRGRVGAPIEVFDGRGRHATAELAEIDRRQVRVSIIEESSTPRPSCQLILAQAIAKGKTIDLVMQKATELGASMIIPLITRNTVVKLDAREGGKKRERWQRTVLEACKQCGQNWLPEVAAPNTLADLFSGQAFARSELRLVASLQPGARHLKDVLGDGSLADGRRPGSVVVIVGPEGDFTKEEVEFALDVGCLPLDLGPIVLRAETAAIYCLSVLGHELFQTGGGSETPNPC